MSDTIKSPASGASGEAPKFTERDLQLLSWAMQSLKSGPPEIDNDKLAAFAGMSNPRSAGNAWSNLKKKLMTSGDSPPPTPKKAAASRKKAVKDDAGEDGEATPKKALRKRANKEPEDSDASPKKKGRPAKPKPKPKQEPKEETCKRAYREVQTDQYSLLCS
ncbi:uncharacterized protein EKO05_0002213 [Ascochyta rabiei]|uniref:uncharacterized protein n=1 Tax=Didymella rabiei TaxID=5454 RepID=UPI002203A3AC|nr:uncharacterized protein EKO05_0002213 [Ascochyta rabiei]UPX11616.1 hypothetical protein EKO05_0002213 [Ascochyta rabiei]